MPTFDELWPPNAAPAFGPWAHPYYIWVNPYRESSAGIRVLYYLCHILNSMGYEAYVTSDNAPKELRAPPLNSDVVNRHRALGRESITVIPESFRGDLFESRVAARYLLNHPGLVNRDFHFSPWELLFSFTDGNVPAGLNYEKLFIPTSDPTLFESAGVDPSERTLTAYYANRILQTSEPLEALPPNAIELSPRVPQRNLRELAALFRRCKVLYCYEYSTICYEAMLCGCPAAFIPTRYLASQCNPIFGKSAEFLPDFELHDGQGICVGIGDEQIQAAARTVGTFREVYLKKSRESLTQIRNFVEITQDYAKCIALTRWRLPRANSQANVATPSSADSSPDTIPPAVLLQAQFKEFCSAASAGDWQGAASIAEQLDLLLDILAQGIGEHSTAAMRSTSVMLRMSGVSFLKARFLLTVLDDPSASIPYFRLAAEQCIKRMRIPSLDDPKLESLLANALIHECLALARAGKSDERERRLCALASMQWSTPAAKLLADRGISLLTSGNEGDPATAVLDHHA